MSLRYSYKKREEFDDWDASTSFIDLNGMETKAYVVDCFECFYLWLEQEQDRDELEEEYGLGHVWDESDADCREFGVREYDDLDELNYELAAVCGDGEKTFFYIDELYECITGC